MTSGGAILWRRLDSSGHDAAICKSIGNGWHLSGVAIVAESARPCRVEYEIACDTSWLTRRCTLRGYIGSTPVALDVRRRVSGSWTVDGVVATSLQDCTDVDLAFTPATNLLPIRRLQLEVGQREVVRAAWIRFPELTVEVLDQFYTRQSANLYFYESSDGAFRRELRVDAFGWVVDYPGLWCAEASVPLHALNSRGHD